MQRKYSLPSNTYLMREWAGEKVYLKTAKIAQNYLIVVVVEMQV